MVDYTHIKQFPSKVYPVETNFTSNLLSRCEPIIDVDKVKTLYLAGVDLSGNNTILGPYTDQMIKDQIIYKMNELELELGIDLYRTQHIERLPFDRSLYKSFIFIKLNHGPVLSLEQLAVESSNGEQIYVLPPEWIEMGFSNPRRQINLIPILSIFGASGLVSSQPSNAGLVFLQAINNYAWLPAFWTIRYTTGISKTEGQVPIVINDLIARLVAMEILANRQNTYRYTNTSISQDGISQSSSSLGPQTYQRYIDSIRLEYEKMFQKVKAIFHSKYNMSNI
jgi:hypothetical protein